MNIFLLGGRDLEMAYIKEMLGQCGGVQVFDNGLSWDNARLSSYAAQIKEFGNKDDVMIYGVELSNDIGQLPGNYRNIDHHGEKDTLPSSLEQTARILGICMDRRMRLIAENDRSYIPGMERAGATPEEIMEIRALDRRAQGVTSETEESAKQAIACGLEEKDSLKIVKDAPSKTFPVISDLLYPYTSLLIYNTDELCFYGNGAQRRRSKIDPYDFSKYGYYGGGENGYCGLDLKSSGLEPEDRHRIIEKNKNMLMDNTPSSYHIFYFPFKWEFERKNDKKVSFLEKYCLDDVIDKRKTAPGSGLRWERVTGFGKDDNAEGLEFFNERQYFFEFVHPVLYDTGDNGIMRHYERIEPRTGNVRYEIDVNDNEHYSLKVDAINLNFYATGIGILTFYLDNDRSEQTDERSIRRINQFGRRIMPPHSGEFNPQDRKLLARELRITGLESSGQDDRYSDTFKYSIGSADTWKPSRILSDLIGDLFDEIRIWPVIDDRMLVCCRYANDELSAMVKDGCGAGSTGCAMTKDFKERWYSQVFIDEDIVTCQNDNMMDKIIEESTYYRWQKYGVLYGTSRYSLFALTGHDRFAENVIAVHVRTIYARLFELIVLQSASVLRFSHEVTRISSFNRNDSKDLYRQSNSLYKEYIRFVNEIYFRNVTSQDQGIELYKMLSSQAGTEKQVKDLDAEIDELNNFVSLQIEKQRSENGEKLNLIATIFLPPTLIAGLFGMNAEMSCSLSFCKTLCLTFIFSMLLWIFIYIYFKKQK